MPRGGKRGGTLGNAYPNRTDMHTAVSTPTYGDKAAAKKSLGAVPLPKKATSSPGRPAPVSAPVGGGQPSAGAPMMAGRPPDQAPGDIPFDRPTDRPLEPLTAGMPMGAGVGPSALMPSVDPVVDTLRAAARVFPNSAIFSLLEDLEK